MPNLSDASTILLLLAPVALPRALQLAVRITATIRRRKIAASAPSSVWQQPQQEQSRATRYFQTCLLLALALHAFLRLTLYRSFDIFNSIAGERIPLNVASSKLAAALQWNNLTQKHGHILPYLTSLDARLLYEHFGQDTFVTAHQVLGTATAKDLLVIHAARLIRLYAVVTLGLALARPRWRNYIGILATAGAVTELYLLATIDISMRGDGSCTSLVSAYPRIVKPQLNNRICPAGYAVAPLSIPLLFGRLRDSLASSSSSVTASDDAAGTSYPRRATAGDPESGLAANTYTGT